jgi:membrane protein implicated in regulation of membrane protease activity
MPDRPPTERRLVRSSDPSLSPDANRLLTDELRAIIGRDEVDVPVGRADPAVAAHGGHAVVVADVIASRLGVVFTALAAICVIAVIALVWNTVAILVVALAVLLVATLLATRFLFGLMREGEHPDPDTAALLEEQGVGDPDRLLQDLVDEFRDGSADARDGR